MSLKEYIAIFVGVFCGCIISDLINGYFRRPFLRFGKFLGKKIRKWLKEQQ